MIVSYDTGIKGNAHSCTFVGFVFHFKIGAHWHQWDPRRGWMR